MNKTALLIEASLGVVMLVAAWFRLYDLHHYPPGLFPDQAANGEDALLILNGDLRPFYERGNGREALFFYLQALSISMFGVGVWQMFIASAVVGVMTVLAMYHAGSVLFGETAGLFASFFLATSFWHVTLSRTGFRAILIPLLILLFTAFAGYAVRAVKERKVFLAHLYAGLAGVAFAGGFYTYIAYRIMVVVVLSIVVLMLIADLMFNVGSARGVGLPHVRTYKTHVVTGILMAFVVLAPLGIYFLQHPDAFIGRAGQVSIFSPDLQNKFGGGTLLGTLAYSTRETLTSFFAGQGDSNWRHSVAGYPLLNPLVAVMFLLGLGWMIHGTIILFRMIASRKEVHMGIIYPYVILLFLGMLIAVVTTAEGLPHGLRSVGLIVPMFLLAGVAAAVSWHWIERNITSEVLRAIARGVLVGGVIVGGFYDYALYFFVARNESAAAYAYRADLTDVAAYINTFKQDFPTGPRPYLVLDGFSVQTVHFLTTVAAHDYLTHPDEYLHKYKLLDPAASTSTPLQPGEIMIFTQSTLIDADRYETTYGTAVERIESRRNRFGQEVIRVIRGVRITVPGRPNDPQYAEYSLDG